MDVAAITALFNILGAGGICLYACQYLMRRLESQEDKQRAQADKQVEEALAREDRLIQSMGRMDEYIRTTMANLIEKNTAAMQANAQALEHLPCSDLRREELEPILHHARRRAGERG